MTDAPRPAHFDKAAASEIWNMPNSIGIVILPGGAMEPILIDQDTSTWVVTHEQRRPENHE